MCLSHQNNDENKSSLIMKKKYFSKVKIKKNIVPAVLHVYLVWSYYMTTDCSIIAEHAVCHEWVNLTKEEQEDYGHR